MKSRLKAPELVVDLAYTRSRSEQRLDVNGNGATTTLVQFSRSHGLYGACRRRLLCHFLLLDPQVFSPGQGASSLAGFYGVLDPCAVQSDNSTMPSLLHRGKPPQM